jgi:PAC2 family protein
VPLYRSSEPTEPLVAPAVVAAFDGWIDAAGASTSAATAIAEGGDVLATFVPDVLFDYRSRRPILDIVDGKPTALVWPELTLRRRRIGPRDVLVLTGAEPDFRWHELGGDVLELCVRLGVVEWVSLGSIPAAVPHTRPVPILATASRPGLLAEDEQQGPEGLLRVPSACLSTIELAVSAGGVPTVGFYAQVPHYVQGPYAAGTIAMLEHAGRHLGVDLPAGPLAAEALAQRQRLDAAVQADDDSRAYVARLEQMTGEEQRLPSGDELASEIERFLRGEGGTSRDRE